MSVGKTTKSLCRIVPAIVTRDSSLPYPFPGFCEGTQDPIQCLHKQVSTSIIKQVSTSIICLFRQEVALVILLPGKKGRYVGPRRKGCKHVHGTHDFLVEPSSVSKGHEKMLGRSSCNERDARQGHAQLG
jgi:hypothetical protein